LTPPLLLQLLLLTLRLLLLRALLRLPRRLLTLLRALLRLPLLLQLSNINQLRLMRNRPAGRFFYSREDGIP
jgi:hypothetical protein